jgi:hypothetical protein
LQIIARSKHCTTVPGMMIFAVTATTTTVPFLRDKILLRDFNTQSGLSSGFGWFLQKKHFRQNKKYWFFETIETSHMEGPATHLFLVLFVCRSYETKPDFAGPPWSICLRVGGRWRAGLYYVSYYYNSNILVLY